MIGAEDPAASSSASGTGFDVLRDEPPPSAPTSPTRDSSKPPRDDARSRTSSIAATKASASAVGKKPPLSTVKPPPGAMYTPSGTPLTSAGTPLLLREGLGDDQDAVARQRDELLESLVAKLEKRATVFEAKLVGAMQTLDKVRERIAAT